MTKTQFRTLSAILAAATSVSIPAQAQQATSTWTGRDIAATAAPITVREIPSVRQREAARPVRGNPYGFRPPRSLYVDPYGNVTVWTGSTPYWMRGTVQGYDPSTPAERAYYSGGNRQPQVQQQVPCTYSGGPATAASAIASAASASGRPC
jgi:hypothetical protein